jgi:FeS assembly protein SufB
MPTSTETIEQLAREEYKFGFITNVEQEVIPKGLDEDVVRLISAKKKEPQWMLDWRLKAYRHWLTMEEPAWPNVHYPPIDYQNAHYYAAPKSDDDRPKSLDEIDPEILETYEKLGIPLREQEMLAGVAVDAVFDSVSVATTFKAKLADMGIVFCSFSEAVHNHPELVRKYLGSVVPHNDNFFAALNSAVFSDGSFVYVPKGVRCPMELSTYFRINAMNTGQFERTLIVADEGAYVSYLEGCTAPMRDEHQLHAAVVELIAHDGAQIKYSTVQNWYPGDKNGKGGIYNFVTKRGLCAGRKSKISWTQVETGYHLEVPELHLEGRRLGRRVLLGGADQQLPAGRHRHQDDPRRQENQEHHHLQGDLRRTRPEHLPRPGQDLEERRRRAQLLAVRLDADGRPLRRPHLPLHRRPEPHRAHGARGDDLEDRRRPDLLLQLARHRHRGSGGDDRQRLLQGSLPEAADGVRRRGPETARDQPRGLCGLRPVGWRRRERNTRC